MSGRTAPRWVLRAGWLAAAILVAVGLAGGGWVWFRGVENRPGPLLAERAVVVPHGGVEAVGQALASAGLIDSVPAFRLSVWLSRREGTLHAAEFAFPAHASLRQVLTVLRTGRPVQHLLTIPEGLTAQQIAGLLNHAEAAVGSVAPPPEGSVLPQTYAYEYGTPRSVILGRAEAAMQKELTAEWADRAPDLRLGSPRDALILASIVERETARPDERAHVAAVYLNRLRLGMRLQADPTVAYAADGGSGVLGHPLTRADLDRDDPYNTYRVVGLPPGPICAPGAASLTAVLHPAASDDLYFVADGSGGHLFAKTREAHERNVARWRALEAAHGSLE